MKKSKILIASLGLMLLTSCGTSPATSNTDSNIPAVQSTGYQKYYEFMLDKAENKNMVFSPESLNTAMYVYSHLTSDEDSKTINTFLNNIDYTKYKNTKAFTMVNRIWANKNKNLDFSKTGVKNLVEEIDMNDSNKATNTKNEYVKKQTNGFIEETDSILDDKTIIDVMNVVYFKDEWLTEKKQTDIEMTFNNIDGSTSPTYYLYDFNGRMYQSKNAHSYTADYKDGFLFTVILPDEGYTLKDINIDEFIDNKCEKVETDNELYMPPFETNSSVWFDFSDFGLNINGLDKNICNEVSAEQILQTAKIKLDKDGTEAAAVTEIITKNAVSIEPEKYIMRCDKPFVYYIYDTTNKDVAFIGVINTFKE